MQQLKKNLIKALMVFISILLFLIYWYHSEGQLGKGDYFLYYTGFDTIKKKNNQYLSLSDVQMVKYDDDFIIAIRIPGRFFYECKTTSHVKTDIIFINKIQYLIIDKNTDLIYGSYDFSNFLNQRKKLGIILTFLESEIFNIKYRFKRKKHIYEDSYFTLEYALQNCKESFIYPLIEI